MDYNSKFYVSLVATVLLGNTPLYAGTISSGGGLIFGNEINPWFLENVSEVHYCLELDNANFGVERAGATEVIRSAIAEWKELFAHNAWTKIYGLGELQPYRNVHLATQTFTEGRCDDRTDLRFQFGILTQDQIDTYGIKPVDTIAITVRTHYDEMALRGKGFIYVGPQTGPLRFESPATVANPWSYCDTCLLKMTLLHELGHVFGLGHAGGANRLMGEQFVDFLTQKKFVEAVEREHAWPSAQHFFERSKKIFSADKNFELIRCDKPIAHEREIPKYLGVNPDTPCIKAKISSESKLTLYTSQSNDGPFVEIGHSIPNVGSTHSSTSSLIRVRLNPEQRVFTHYPEDDNNLLGPASQEVEKRNVDFLLHNGTRRQISYRIKPGNSLDIIGAVDNRIFVYDATP